MVVAAGFSIIKDVFANDNQKSELSELDVRRPVVIDKKTGRLLAL